jgi:formamidopyrimidine-DNA glycosylase
MPELPDVEMLRRYIENTSLDQKIVEVNAEHTRLLRVDESVLVGALKGSCFKRCTRHGKLAFLITDRGRVLILHFGMTGNLHYLRQNESKPDYTRLLICFENDNRLSYTSTRKLGRIDLTDDIDGYIRQNHLGPDALEVDKQQFKSIIGASTASIKSILMDQSKIAGIGNIYSDEILFQAQIHPGMRANELCDDALDRLFLEMKCVLKIAIDRQADSISFPDSWIIHSRSEGAHCPRCGSRVEKLKISGRTSYFCPVCQKI